MSAALRWLRQQQLYIAIAVAVYAVFWAIQPGRADMLSTLIYSLLLCNLTVLVQEMDSAYVSRPPRSYWLIYLALLLATTPVWVVLSSIAVYWLTVTAPRPGLADFLRQAWKFPFVATIIFGVAMQLYRSTKTRLERSNRELRQTVDLEIANRELQAQELERAREIQQGLLPKEIPQIPGFEIAGAWEPARVVGGDYFDVIKLSESRVGICIADVVGKSVSAALLMANVQATVRAFAADAASPAWLCSRVNSVLCNNIATGKFVTLFYGVLDAERRTLEYTNAGHLRPILVGAKQSVQPLDNGGALLGVFPEWKYEDSVAQLGLGDRLLLFTDGITEAARPDGEEFGEERLIQIAAREQRSAAELKDCLLTRVREFCNSQLADDATLIVIAAGSHPQHQPRSHAEGLQA
ncbi:MAG TPA: PP2C family protein-serine/threonine phosphatase [Terriglobales bacterium]|nr:PP2C family protein-serine/threonine phosphatase [Terriglobales bacterium]